MAEIQDNEGGRGRSTRKNTRIDMTAMVDVAFLLLTFFILTTTMGEPMVMELSTPVPENKDVACSKVMTIYLGANDQIHSYTGCDPEKLSTTNFTAKGIRKEIMDQMFSVDDLIISIKPTPASRYKNMVDILDEMNITDASKYALAKLTPEDEQLLKIKGLKIK